MDKGPLSEGNSVSAEKSANLCWGQRYHWLRYHHVPPGARHDAHIVVNCPLPEGLSLTALRATVNYLVRRHEALRTIIDPDARPWPQQRVQPPAPLPLRLVSTDSDGPTPAEVVRELTLADFDLAREWPIRAGVITTDGRPIRLVLVLNHVAFDDWSLEMFRREFESMIGAVTAQRRASLPPVVHQPVDLARAEAARQAAGDDAELNHWREEITHLPADVWACRRITSADQVTAHSASITSPGLLTAAREIAARAGVWPSAVHLASYAVAVAAYTGEPLIPFRWLTSHREANPQMSVMTCMFSPTFVGVDLTGDPTFGEVLRRTAAAVAQSQEHAYVPYDEIVELVSRESFRRGQPMRVNSEVNFLSYAPRSCGTRRDRFAWHPSPTAWAQAGTDTYFCIYEWCDGVTATLHAHGDVMTAADVERFLRGYLRLINRYRDGADLRLSEAAREFDFPAAPSGKLVRIGPDLVAIERTEVVLHAHPAVAEARLFVGDRGLTAQVSARTPVSARQLRTHMLSAIYDQPAVRCPSWFEITGPDGLLQTGDGRDTDLLPPVSPEEETLLRTVAAVNDLGPVDAAVSYTEAGGRALRVPATLAALRHEGWTGLSADLLASARPLRALASLMRKVE